MGETNASSDDKLFAAVGYLWILSVIILAVKKDNPYVRFHASQGSLIFVCSLVLMFIPVIGWMINCILGVIAIVAIIKALQGEKWPIPVGADYAVKFGDLVIKTLKI